MSPSGHLSIIEAPGGGAHSGFMHAAALALLLIVRSYDVTELPGRDVHAAYRVASDILARASVAAEWIDCTSATDAARCQTPLQSDEVVIRIVTSPVGQRSNAATLGFAYVDHAAGAGTLATIYADRITLLALASGTHLETLLGRAIAHEIGHLLMGTNAHPRRGVMRAEWTPQLLQRGLVSDWRFSQAEGRALRDALLRRYQPRSTPLSWSSSQVLSGAK